MPNAAPLIKVYATSIVVHKHLVHDWRHQVQGLVPGLNACMSLLSSAEHTESQYSMLGTRTPYRYIAS